MYMAYDSKADRVILFGGQTGDFNTVSPSPFDGETWVYDVAANSWTQMKPPSGPTIRQGAQMVYDAKADRVILFGGWKSGLSGPLNDTWAYDYNTNTWTEMAQGPVNALGASIAYDQVSDRIVLFGGGDGSGNLFNDTWAFDYNTNAWTEMPRSAIPPPRIGQVMVYDAKADRVIMWGGNEVLGGISHSSEGPKRVVIRLQHERMARDETWHGTLA